MSQNLYHYLHTVDVISTAKNNKMTNLQRDKCTCSIVIKKVKSAHEPSGPHRRSLSQFPQHEATWNIATPPRWDASPSQVTPQHFIRFPWQFAGIHLYSWVEGGIVRVKCLAQEHNTFMTQQGLKPGLFNPESSMPTIMPRWPHLPWNIILV